MKKGSNHTEEAKQKMSKAKSGENHPMWGMHHSEETKRRMVENHVGMLGKHHTEEAKQKMSEIKKGVKFSDEHKRKLSEAQGGPKNHNWKGGQEYYRGRDWFWQRDRALKRDNGVCQCCENIDNKRKNDTHHWIPYRLSRDNGLNNLITLCHRCHGHIEHNFIIDFPLMEAFNE